MRNLLMLLVAVLGTSVMVNAFPAKGTKPAQAKEVKATPAKENKATNDPGKKADKKAKSGKSVAPKTEAAKAKK